MKYMLDTNTCVFAINGNTSVRSRFILEHGDIAISTVVEAELWFGVENSMRPMKNAVSLRSFLATVEILPFDTLAAMEYGRIRAALKRAGTPIGLMDTLIAAHAKAAGLVCVTNNVREFGRVEGLAVEDWTV
ncbi:MAG: type II toxin-antitoxin system VapC family toxin [Oscillospiraceae bacterium]|nr:type II toxin-antitoxin system VapC family toxin [Oscillospiraceae bacterium]